MSSSNIFFPCCGQILRHERRSAFDKPFAVVDIAKTKITHYFGYAGLKLQVRFTGKDAGMSVRSTG